MRKKNLQILLLICTIILNFSCRENVGNKIAIPETKQIDSVVVIPDSVVVITEKHTGSNSLDWKGSYKGILPCADCEGLVTEMILNGDNSYVIKTMYQGKSDKIIEEKGSFTWNSAGNIIVLSGVKNKPNQYFVAENKLIQLDLAGNKITGNLAAKYILSKQ